MTLVQIIKNWDFPNLIRQTPKSSGVWNNIQFTTEDVKRCDYVVILNGSQKNLQVECPSENIWLIVQEPPTNNIKNWHSIPSYCSKIFTTIDNCLDVRYISSHPALPWYIDQTYDYLKNCNIPSKEKNVSWITSNKNFYDGHKKRLQFMQKIKKDLDFDLYGRGYQEISDKWFGLAPYKYSLAIENFSNQYYWTEKIADCFLAWTMPIYYGCTKITDFFPSESLIHIDISSDTVVEQIKNAITQKKWEKNLDAIAYSRSLILDNYQFFPMITSYIVSHESIQGRFLTPKVNLIPDRFKELEYRKNWMLLQSLKNKIRKI
jgi:hypothetical protein